MVLFRYDDVPGVIGRVGTLFGDAGVNIANMTVSRTREGDKALMALSIDSTRRPSSSSGSAARASTTSASSRSAEPPRDELSLPAPFSGEAPLRTRSKNFLTKALHPAVILRYLQGGGIK